MQLYSRKRNNVWVTSIQTSVWPCGCVAFAEQLISCFPLHRSSTDSKLWYESLLLRLELKYTVRVAHQRAPLLQVIFLFEHYLIMEYCVIQYEQWIDTALITVFTKVTWPRNLSFRLIYITSLQWPLAGQWIESLKFKWKWQTPREGGWPWLEVEGHRFISCATWVRPPAGCSRNNLCMSFTSHVFWMMKVFRLVKSSKWN